MFKKIFVVFLFVMAFGAFSLEAAMSKSEANSMMKKIMVKWDRKSFSSKITKDAFFLGSTFKYALKEWAEWKDFKVKKVSETKTRLTIKGVFKDEDEIEDDGDTTFIFCKESGKWVICEILFYDEADEEETKFNFQKNRFE